MPDQDKSTEEKATQLRAQANRMILQEIEYSKRQMTESEWRARGETVTRNIVTAAKTWLVLRSEEGLL